MNDYIACWQKFADFSGRSRRREFWMFVLFNALAGCAAGILDGILGMGIVSALYGLAVLIPSWAVSFRRLHDTGRSGWWWLIGIIPIIGGIVLFIFAIQDSQPGDNQYGPNPKGL